MPGHADTITTSADSRRILALFVSRRPRTRPKKGGHVQAKHPKTTQNTLSEPDTDPRPDTSQTPPRSTQGVRSVPDLRRRRSPKHPKTVPNHPKPEKHPTSALDRKGHKNDRKRCPSTSARDTKHPKPAPAHHLLTGAKNTPNCTQNRPAKQGQKPHQYRPRKGQQKGPRKQLLTRPNLRAIF